LDVHRSEKNPELTIALLASEQARADFEPLKRLSSFQSFAKSYRLLPNIQIDISLSSD
jgi:hypothetical protein